MSVQTYGFEPIHTLLADLDPAGELRPCGLRRLVLGSDAITSVARTVDELLREVRGEIAPRNPPHVAMLVDATCIGRAGDDVKDIVAEQLAQRFDVRRAVLDDGQQELHVVPDVLDTAADAVRGVDAVVAVGGGTISDIAKVATHRARSDGARPVLVSVQTAASVDGYTDDVSVVLRDGVKRTVPACWPDGVVADAETIAEAPALMNRAGFGEATSMLVAPGDWRLASLVGTDDTFHSGPIRLLETVGADIDSWSPGVSRGDKHAIASLTRALGLRGVATGISGTTAVLSGVEHLVSHMLDQYHSEHQLPMGLHGAQVGVASVVAAAAWEMLFERIAARSAPVPIDAAVFEPARARARIDAAFEAVDPTGRIAQECWTDYSKKLAALTANRSRLAAVLDEWPTHEAKLRALVRPSGVIATALRAAGAAATFAELEPRIAPELARWAVANCALMRNRFTVVDLLTLAGWWTDADVDEVLDRAGRALSAADGRAGADGRSG